MPDTSYYTTNDLLAAIWSPLSRFRFVTIYDKIITALFLSGITKLMSDICFKKKRITRLKSYMLLTYTCRQYSPGNSNIFFHSLAMWRE